MGAPELYSHATDSCQAILSVFTVVPRSSDFCIGGGRTWKKKSKKHADWHSYFRTRCVGVWGALWLSQKAQFQLLPAHSPPKSMIFSYRHPPPDTCGIGARFAPRGQSEAADPSESSVRRPILAVLRAIMRIPRGRNKW